MKPNLIWGIRSNKCNVLKGVCRQCWSVFCSEVSQASGSGGPVSFLSNDGRSRSVFHCCRFCLLVCSYLTFKTFSLGTDFLVFKGEALTGYVAIVMASVPRITVGNLHQAEILRLFPTYFPRTVLSGARRCWLVIAWLAVVPLVSEVTWD